jgi:hypothetical protein
MGVTKDPAWPCGRRAPVPVSEVLAQPRQILREPGLYGWFFEPAALGLDAAGCHCRDGWPLLYVGLAQGRADSQGHLRGRIIGNHLRGNAGSSTLRRSIGSILRSAIGLRLHLGTSRGSDSWGPGEAALTNWLASNARIVWCEGASPWLSERQLLAGGALRLPLNIQGNAREPLRPWLQALRRQAVLDGLVRAEPS